MRELESWEVMAASMGWAWLSPSFLLFPLKAFPRIPAKRNPALLAGNCWKKAVAGILSPFLGRRGNSVAGSCAACCAEGFSRLFYIFIFVMLQDCTDLRCLLPFSCSFQPLKCCITTFLFLCNLLYTLQPARSCAHQQHSMPKTQIYHHCPGLSHWQRKSCAWAKTGRNSCIKKTQLPGR